MAIDAGPCGPTGPMAGAPIPVATAGDEVAVAFERFRPELQAYAIARFGGSADAEDLVQEAFVRLLRETSAGRAPLNPRAWLYRVAHNLAVSDLRRRPALTDPLEPERLPGREPVVDVRLALVEREDLRTALATLAPSARLALCMAAEGYTGREIAWEIGRTERATRTLLCRTRRTVRSALEGDTERSAA